MEQARITPRRPAIGSSVIIACEIANRTSVAQRLLVDLRVQYVKANGVQRPKVFKLKQVELAPRETAEVKKTLSLAQLTTRTHYPGRHVVDVMVNGRAYPLGTFDLIKR